MADAFALFGLGNWLPVTFIALTISLFIAAAYYMIARFFQSYYLEAEAKIELQEVFKTVIIVSSIPLILLFANGFANYAGTDIIQAGESTHHIDKAIELVQDRIDGWDVVMGQLATLYGDMNAWMSYSYTVISSYTPTITPISCDAIIKTKTETPGAGLAIFFVPLSQISNSIMTGVGLNTALKQFLIFVKENAFSLLLPAGIILRSFAFSRRIGSTLIAIGISLYVALPLSVIIGENLYEDPGRPSIPTIGTPSTPPDILCNPLWKYIWKGNAGHRYYVTRYCPKPVTGCGSCTGKIWQFTPTFFETGTPPSCSPCPDGETWHCTPGNQPILGPPGVTLANDCCAGDITPPPPPPGCTKCVGPINPGSAPVGCGEGPIFIPKFPIMQVPIPVVGPPPGCMCCMHYTCMLWCELNVCLWYQTTQMVQAYVAQGLLETSLGNEPTTMLNTLKTITPVISYYVMMSTVIVVFSGLVTASIARSLSELMGGDSRFYGLYKII